MDLSARPDRGAIRPYVPGGTVIARSVLTRELECAAMVMSWALDRSYPAARSEPFVGIVAESDKVLTSSCGCSERSACIFCDGISAGAGVGGGATGRPVVHVGRNIGALVGACDV